MTAPQKAKQTLEQKRAQHAWLVSREYDDKHVTVAKSLPALLMSSGLMQVAAFCYQKGGAQGDVATDLRQWLAGRFPHAFPDGGAFSGFMTALMNMDSRTYQLVHAEAFSWLKWLRQLSAARHDGA